MSKQEDQEPSRAAEDYQGRGWSREESVGHVAAFERRASWAISQRAFSREHGVPRATLQHWCGRKSVLAATSRATVFYESPDGLEFLHRLQVALHFVLGFLGPNGLRHIMEVITLSGLDAFIANSFGSQQKFAVQMQASICAFGSEERGRLGATMPAKEITACQDETFHPAPCLVAIEPVSNFILLEQYAQGRDAATWNDTFKAAIGDLPVRVIQSTSDEGKGLLAHVRAGLGAHHSPDVFHGQQALSRSTSIALAGQVRQAERAVGQAQAGVARVSEHAASWAHTRHGPGRPPNFAARALEAESTVQAAQQVLHVAQERQERARHAIRGIGQAYHPVDLKTGAPVTPAQVTDALEEHFAAIATVAREASLPERCLKGIDKAHRLVPLFTSTLAFVASQVRARLDKLDLPAALAAVVEQYVLPIAYLKRAAVKAQSADAREALRQLVARLSEDPHVIAAMDSLAPDRLAHVERVVAECADLFQRSSSCVEGRNGQLSLQHHGLHRISASRLEALTVVHNFFIRRSDGTTAAQRFFGTKPEDLFDRLLGLPKPSRPASSRPDRGRLMN